MEDNIPKVTSKDNTLDARTVDNEQKCSNKAVKIEEYDALAGVEINVDDMPIHRTGKSRKLPFLSKNCHS